MPRLFLKLVPVALLTTFYGVLLANMVFNPLAAKLERNAAEEHLGPGGNYLGQRHTRKHMRERWMPTLMDRRPYNIWEEKKDGARDWAREKAQQILNDYHPSPLDPKLDAELLQIIERLEADVHAFS